MNSCAGPCPRHRRRSQRLTAVSNPLDSARLLTQAKAELIESQNHLIDALDQRFITTAAQTAYDKMARDVIDQVDGWRDYLQSPDAQRNVKAIKNRRKRDRTTNSNKNPNPNQNRNPDQNRDPE